MSNKLEFCVCFRSDETEYWDSNNVSFKLLRLYKCAYAIVIGAIFLMHFISLASILQGQNYGILKRTSKYFSQSSNMLHKNDTKIISTTVTSNPMAIPQKYSDLTQAKMTAWSEFASWNHLENNCPYW